MLSPYTNTYLMNMTYPMCAHLRTRLKKDSAQQLTRQNVRMLEAASLWSYRQLQQVDDLSKFLDAKCIITGSYLSNMYR